MASADHLWSWTATALAAAVRTRQLSPVEVVDSVLDRIEAVNPRINAFTTIVAEGARAAAARAETQVLSGEELGPLHGVPFTLKDLTPTAGVRTTWGSRAFADYVPDESSIVTERIAAAGGILLGKTTTSELGNKGVTESPLTGVTNNPWRTTHIAGGSSGGAAAAVAAGCGPLAEGNDGGGSIRVPASCCGVVGFKPSFGLVPSFPPSAFHSLSHQGPIARTVADAALLLSSMAGPDDRVPFSIAAPAPDYVAELGQTSVRGLRVALSVDLGMAPVDPVVVESVRAAATLFAYLGAEVEETTPDLPHPEQHMLTIWAAGLGTAATDRILPTTARADIDPALLSLVDRSRSLSAADYYRSAYTFRGEYYQRMLAFFTSVDLLLTPTITTPPFPHPGALPGPESVAGEPINPHLGWLLTYPFNLTGQPAISVPCGWTDDGLPIGLQIVGRRHQDLTVLRAAAAFEQVAPWSDRRPPL